jgi:hypothetical protein
MFGIARKSDSGTGGALRSAHDAAVRAPEPGGARCSDSSTGPPSGPSQVWQREGNGELTRECGE